MKTTITFNTSLLAYLFLLNISILNVLNVSIKTYTKKMLYVKIVYLKMNKTYIYIYIYEEKSLKYQCMACICFPLNLLFNIHYLYI